MCSILTIIALLAAFPTTFLGIQLIFAHFGSRARVSGNGENPSDFAIMIPAHNEENVIGITLDSLLSQVTDADSILVVADNCTDDTAAIARDRGVEVIERDNSFERGKGYALEYGVKHLLARPSQPSCVVFVDADCLLEPNAIGTLVYECAETARPIQALYLMKNRGLPGIGQKVAEFAWIIKNRVRPLGLMRLGLPCQLMGTGMAFPTELLKQLELGTPDIVEDMKLGIDCAVLGYHPVYCPAAVVVSFFPEDNSGAKNQRIRWEHGHLGMMLYGITRLLKAAFVRRDGKCLGMAMDLTIPPVAFLVLVLLALILLSAIANCVYQSGFIAIMILLVSALIFGLSLLAAWYRFARDAISPGELLWIPVYVFSKIPIYATYWLKRQVDWVRTNRK